MSNLIIVQSEVDLGENSHDGKGCVYIIESDGCIKIGKTKNIAQRINTLRNQSGRKFLRFCHTEQCKNYGEIEIAMHKEFSESRTVGEWFNIPFDQAAGKLATYQLDLTKMEEKEFNPDELLRVIDDEFKEHEIQRFLDERPVFRDYLKANGFRVYYYDRSDELLVTNDDEIEMPLMLFLAIYKSQTA